MSHVLYSLSCSEGENILIIIFNYVNRDYNIHHNFVYKLIPKLGGLVIAISLYIY